MCGRFAQGKPEDIIQFLTSFVREASKLDFVPRWNIAPSSHIITLANTDGSNELMTSEWGLMPGWMKNKPSSKQLINARSETVFEKPAFKNSIKRRRCVVPITGFYEWQRAGSRKQPWYFYPEQEHGVLPLAGLWQASEDGVTQFALLTREADKVMAPIHHRMPVILNQDEINGYLEPAATEDEIRAMIEAERSGQFAKYEVETIVNNARYDGPDCIEPVSRLI